MKEIVGAKKSRIRNMLILGAIGVGLIPIFVLGLFVYMNVTKKPLHPDVNAVSAVMSSAPAPKWSRNAKEAGDISRAYLAEKNLPGLSVAVGVGGAVVWAEGFGWADLEEKVPVAPDTRFRIGSASIALASAAVGLLVEQGKLRLDDPIQSSVPGYPKKEWPVTLRQVMSHVGGIPSDGGDESPMFSEHCERAGEGLRFFSDRALRFEPGTHYSFSNYGWVLVSAAIESAAGEPFARYMRKHVIEPLGLIDTRIENGAELVAGMAPSYFPVFRADPAYGLDPFRALRLSCYAGAGAVVSTPSDLVRFAMAINGGKLLQPATVQLFQTSQRLQSGVDTGYGLGWDLETAKLAGKPTALVGHDGDILGGQAASFMTFTEYGITVAVISNTSYAGTFDLAVKIAQIFKTAK